MTMTQTKLGKIRSVNFGYGGYDDAMFGITFQLGNDDWGVSDFRGAWKRDINTLDKNTAEKHVMNIYNVWYVIINVMDDAKVKSIHELIDIPVEVTFDDKDQLISWRVLKEVL